MYTDSSMEEILHQPEMYSTFWTKKNDVKKPLENTWKPPAFLQYQIGLLGKAPKFPCMDLRVIYTPEIQRLEPGNDGTSKFGIYLLFQGKGPFSSEPCLGFGSVSCVVSQVFDAWHKPYIRTLQ